MEGARAAPGTYQAPGTCLEPGEDALDGKGEVSVCLHSLEAVLKQFKHWTAHEAKHLLGLRDRRFWQREWFDHWSRSLDEDQQIEDYIRENPVKAGLVQRWQDWPWVR